MSKNTPNGSDANSITINNREIAKTSIEAYHNNITRQRIPKIEDRILEYLQTVESDTSRGISEQLEVERNSITQPLKNLEKNKGLITIRKIDKCPKTNYKVRFYGLADQA